MEKIRCFKVNKLVRDNIPSILEAQGIKVTGRVMEKEEYIERLKDKLLEETKEVRLSNTREELLEELADVLEVMMHLAGEHEISLEQILEMRKGKAKKKGAFAQKLYISSIDIEEGNEAITYYTARVDQYPEIK